MLTATLRAELANIRIAANLARSSAEVFANTHGFTGNIAEFAHAFELSVSEAFTNAVRYGDPSNADAVVHISIESGPGSITITVKDNNPPFDPAPPTPEIQGYPEGGFGLFIIGKLMDEVKCEHEGGGNTLAMTKHIG